MRRIVGFSVAFVMCATVRVGAQVNRCAECHFANLANVPAPQALARWSQSAHGKHGIACSNCHGGDATTYQAIDAHRGVLDARHLLSSVNRASLALTCASCHAGVVAAYRASAHGSAPDPDRAPACTTCHGPMGGERPSASRLDGTCRPCHSGDSAHAAYGSLARARVDALIALDETLTRIDRSIGSMDDPRKRGRLSAELALARASLHWAVESLHTFDFHAMDVQRAAAQRKISELLAALLATS